MTIISQYKPKARKVHFCNWCAQKIQPGELYDKAANVYDGKIYTWKNHFACMKIATRLNMWDDVDDGVTENDFQESIQNEYCNLMSKHQNELYESDDFELPDFRGQLKFVLDFYQIPHTL